VTVINDLMGNGNNKIENPLADKKIGVVERHMGFAKPG